MPALSRALRSPRSNLQKQTAELARNRQKPGQVNERIRLDGIKTAESPVITGIIEGASEAVKVWGPHAMTGVETPPDRPGLAVIKRVSATEAEPGDTMTYAIIYRNMGNTPIRSVAIVDSLLPRLEYVKGTSKGPERTVFSTAVNRVGSTELRWELPGVLRARGRRPRVVPGNRALIPLVFAGSLLTMTDKQFRELCSLRPFQPFDLHMADGRTIPVSHPELHPRHQREAYLRRRAARRRDRARADVAGQERDAAAASERQAGKVKGRASAARRARR